MVGAAEAAAPAQTWGLLCPSIPRDGHLKGARLQAAGLRALLAGLKQEEGTEQALAAGPTAFLRKGWC